MCTWLWFNITHTYLIHIFHYWMLLFPMMKLNMPVIHGVFLKKHHAFQTHWKRLWCWEGLGAGGEGDDRGWDGWMASLTRWTWVWVSSGSWWWTGRPGVLRFMGLQRVGHDWATELNCLNRFENLFCIVHFLFLTFFFFFLAVPCLSCCMWDLISW